MVRIKPTHDESKLFDFKGIKQRFFDLNKQRLQRAKQDMRQRQLDFLELLPTLYHINHPLLPGYISKQTPTGIPDYSPTAQALRLAKRMAKSFSYKSRAYRHYAIHAIYIMGSTGTIAYSDTSDLDIWICYEGKLSSEQVELLQQKSDAITEWAQSQDIDASIFLVDPERIRTGQQDNLSSEGVGSALHYLLLEEFYRSSFLLAGRYPIWWLVPPQHEHNYDEFVADIKLKRYVHSRDHIDFGGLSRVPAGEFYGATLWLLYKGINSPYKSVLKILLMEAYASEHPDIDLLGLRFKQAIYNGENELNKLDPYLMMMRKVEEFLIKQQDHERLELARRCFYIKINERLSENNNKREHHWRRQLTAELIYAWNWHTSQLFMLDSKADWKIQRVSEERSSLIQVFTQSYRFLSDFARSNANTNIINSTDLNVLGRKLYAAFERKAGKIDIIYCGITAHLHETHLSIHRLHDDDGRFFWIAFNGVVNENEVAHLPPLKRAYSIIELLAWLFFNKIITPNTVTSIYGYGSDFSEKELNIIIADMLKLFDDDLLNQDNITELKQPATILQVCTIINAGVDPFLSHTRRGEHLTSNRTDSLRYGGRLENLVTTIDQIIVTSWHEVLTFHYSGIDGLFQCLQDYMNWAPPGNNLRPPRINAHSHSCYRGDAIAQRTETLFETIFDCFYTGNKDINNVQYVMGIEWDYYVLYMKNGYLEYLEAGNLQQLKQYLSAPSNGFKHVVFDPQTLNDDALSVIYAQNKPNEIQCYFLIKNEQVNTYIIDEKGSLYHQQSPFYDAMSLINHYQQFFAAVQRRMSFYIKQRVPGKELYPIRYHYLEPDHNKGWRIINHRSNNLFKPKSYLSLQVIVDRVDDEIIFRIYCNDREFSTVSHGRNLYTGVAEHILKLRQNKDNYPIYITDIDIAPTLLDYVHTDMQTIHYLAYKNQIESRLLSIIES